MAGENLIYFGNIRVFLEIRRGQHDAIINGHTSV